MNRESQCIHSTRATEDVVRAGQSLSKELINNLSLSRVYNLRVQAISHDNDKLRRFMFAWLSLEILINKVFSEYEKLFVQNLLGTAPPSHTMMYFERIRAVMNGKYSIVDKFIVMAACVGDNDVESDIKDFIEIKKNRDAFLHGEPIDEDSLPILNTIRLLKKYLRLHINAKAT